MKSIFNFIAAVISLILLSGCTTITPTQINVTGTASGSSGSNTVSIAHGSNLESTAPIVISSPSSVSGLTDIAIDLTRTGAATSTGYEFYTIFRNLFVGGGGGLFRGAVAGNSSLASSMTGSIAKTSYYFFEDTGGQNLFELSDTNAATRSTTSLILARVRAGIDRALVPDIDSNADRSIFFGLGCLTGGDDPCFDMNSLVSRLFGDLSTAFTSVAAGSSDISLGGSGSDGDFKMDYIPATTTLRGCGQPANSDPAFGFVFAATINGPAATSFRVRFPIVFSATNGPTGPGEISFTALVHPFDDIGGCNPTQLVSAITVSSSTLLGIGAQSAANTARNQVVCSLFGAVEAGQNCTDITLSPLPPLVVAGLGAMVGNTLTYYWRKARGASSAITPNVAFLLRPRNSDNIISSTDVTPGNTGAAKIQLVFLE